MWKKVFGYEADHNAPELVIDKKLDFRDGLFFIATDNQDVIGTVMAGYDGHRGWIVCDYSRELHYYDICNRIDRCRLQILGQAISAVRKN